MLDGRDFAAVVQRNHVVGREGSDVPVTAGTLIRARAAH